MREVARYKWNEAKYDPTTQTLGEFLKDLKKIAKQANGNEADKCIRMFLFKAANKYTARTDDGQQRRQPPPKK